MIDAAPDLSRIEAPMDPDLAEKIYELDRRSLEFHRRISEEVRRDPTHLQRARENLIRWKAGDPRGCPGLDAWLLALDQGPDAAIAAMLDASETGQYMLSCTPFTRVLPPRVRADFFRQWSATN